jgi:hypothetical protein
MPEWRRSDPDCRRRQNDLEVQQGSAQSDQFPQQTIEVIH